MKAILEPKSKDTAMIQNKPLWIAVDKTVQKFPPVKGRDGTTVKAANETSVRCYISIMDYQNSGDAEKIAEAIIKALEVL